MNFLFDNQDDAPALVPVVLEGKAVVEAFRALLAVYLAGDLPALEVTR